jgi:hypothetical protein
MRLNITVYTHIQFVINGICHTNAMKLKNMGINLFLLKYWSWEYETGKITVQLKFDVFRSQRSLYKTTLYNQRGLWQVYIVKFKYVEVIQV